MADPTDTDRKRQGLSHLAEVRATFRDSGQMQAAVNELTMHGFDRAELTLPARGHSLDEPGSEGATYAATEAGVEAEQHTRDDQAAAGHLVLSVRTPTAEKVEKAKAILTSAGGTDLQTIGE